MIVHWLLAASLAFAAGPGKFPGIKKVTERKYVVDEATANAASADMTQVLQTARMVPYLEGEKFAGFLFQDIADDSIFKALGFRRGDVLKRVNDVVFDNPAKGFLAFAQLKEAKRWTVHLVRKKKTIKMDYRLKKAASR